MTEMKRTVLLVEDEILIRLIMSEGLRDEGHHVIEAANADEAQTILASKTGIDILVTDINMPGSLDGLELAALVKADHPALPVLIVSSHLPGPLDARADGFLAKPFVQTDLARAIGTLVGTTWKTHMPVRKAS